MESALIVFSGTLSLPRLSLRSVTTPSRSSFVASVVAAKRRPDHPPAASISTP